MSTSCADIIARAQAFSALNTGLTSDSVEMLSRIRSDQKAIFTSVSAITFDYFQTTANLSSTTGASGRVLALPTNPPLERILVATLGDGRLLSQVDVRDPSAELSPRYFVRGQTLVEVGSDWGTSGSKTATLVYAYGPTDITTGGGTAQAVSVPDAWIDLLVIPLAMYLHTKDPGRPPEEYQTLSALNDEKQTAFTTFLRNYGGVESQRFIVPSPLASSKKS